MKANFNSYSKIWELKTTDKNIDHRRVPNLMNYFKKIIIQANQYPLTQKTICQEILFVGI